MLAREPELIPIGSEMDIVRARQAARAQAKALNFSLVDQTKLVTAVSELARNTLEHGRGGTCQIEVLQDNGKTGLRLSFEDRGPGIPNVEQALSDGFTSTAGLGLGLGGARRLVHEFDIQSEPGAGTRVTITRWKK